MKISASAAKDARVRGSAYRLMDTPLKPPTKKEIAAALAAIERNAQNQAERATFKEMLLGAHAVPA